MPKESDNIFSKFSDFFSPKIDEWTKRELNKLNEKAKDINKKIKDTYGPSSSYYLNHIRLINKFKKEPKFLNIYKKYLNKFWNNPELYTNQNSLNAHIVNIASETVVNAVKNIESFLTQGKENKKKNDAASMEQNANRTKEAMKINTWNKITGISWTSTDALKFKGTDSNTYFRSWINEDPRKTCRWLSLRELFFQQLKKQSYSAEEINKMYHQWNIERLSKISKLFNLKYITTYTHDKGLASINSTDQVGLNYYNTFVSKRWHIDNKNEQEQNNEKSILNEFSQYTQWELIWEFLKNIDTNPDWLLNFQIFITSLTDWNNAFNLEHATWKWNEDTLIFLNNLLNDPTFTREPRYQEYAATINKILEEHKDIDYKNKESKFKTLSEDQRILDEYWKDPEAFWKKQNIEWRREFEWITAEQLIEWWWDYKSWEQNFINRNSQYLDSQISKLFELPTWENLSEKDKDEIEEKRSRIRKLLPSEDLNRIYDDFSKNPEVQERFKKLLAERNLPPIDLNNYSIKSAILNGNFDGNKYEEVLKDCYNGIWSTFWNEIMWLTNQALQYLKSESWWAALNIRNDVLKHFLPWISIRPEKENNWIFYFRDENNLDTLYQFNPKTWEIALHDNISNETDWVVDLWWWSTSPLLTIKWYEWIINSLQVWELLPNSKANNFEELQKNLLNSIKSKITVDWVSDIGVVNWKNIQLSNEKNTCKNELVWDFKFLLWVEASKVTKEEWMNYTLFNSLANTFKKIDSTPSIDNHQLITMRNFFYKVCESINAWNPVKADILQWIQNSENEKGNEQETDENLWNWKADFIKKLIDPQTKTFNIDLMEQLLNDSEFQTELNRSNFANLLRVVDKWKELYDLEIQKNKDINNLYSDIKKELWNAYNDDMLYSNINNLEENELLS